MTVSSGSSRQTGEVFIDDKKYDFIGRPLSDNELLLTINGRQFPVYVAQVGSETQLFLNGKIWHIDDLGDADRRPKRKGGPDEQEKSLTPPMPAVVIRLLVAEGDVVKKKQPLIVLSAMKMETTLSAPYNGTVKKINATAGEQVMPGLILVEIEKAGEEEDGK
jgi:3-methylcrotonyl-CoA carboxylase alpha subunit